MGNPAAAPTLNGANKNDAKNNYQGAVR